MRPTVQPIIPLILGGYFFIKNNNPFLNNHEYVK